MQCINLFIRILFISLPILLSGCHAKEDSKDDRTVFRYNESKGIATLDPAYAKSQTIIWPVHQLFNGLVQLSDSLQVEPCIAKSWSISEDGKEYTFYLRNDVFFHDHEVFEQGKGRKVQARDFVYSLDRISDKATASPGSWIFKILDRNEQNKHTGLLAVNDTTLKIFLSKPFPVFLGLLTMQYCSVVPHEVVEYYGKEFGQHPVGTGPFKFKTWKDGEKLVYIKNIKYFEKDNKGERLPYLDAVSISFISDKQSEFMEFMLGKLDFISGVQSTYKDELITRLGLLNPKYRGRIKMLTQSYLNTEYLGILADTTIKHMRGNPLKYKKVRQAINFAFDRKAMMAYLRNNIGYPAENGFIPRGLPSFNSGFKGYTYDRDMARQLLVDAGFPEGRDLSEITLLTTSDYLDLCEYIQHEVAEIGIKLRIEVSDGATFREQVANSKVGFFRGSWIADYPDAENYLALFYSKNFSPGGPNYTHFKSISFDSLYNIAASELNDSLRYDLYRKMDRIIIEEAVVVPLFYDVVVRFVQQDIQDFTCNPLNLLNLKKVRRNIKE